MKLSDKLNQLSDDIQDIHFNIKEVNDGFNRAIEDAEYLEAKEAEFKKLIKVIEKEQFNDDETPNENGDLCTIGEAVLNELDMWT